MQFLAPRTGQNRKRSQTQIFQKKYTLSHMIYVSQALQGKHVSISAPLFRRTPYVEIDSQILNNLLTIYFSIAIKINDN